MAVQLEPRTVRGFRFAGVSAGLKTQAGVKDLGLAAAERPVAVAGVFTTNRVKAAPVILAERCARGGRIQAIVANSGSANCFTGKAGIRLAVESCDAVARAVGCDASLVAPASTGVIGRLYDFETYRAGVNEAAAVLEEDRLEDFARAIMTTDTKPKLASTSVRIAGAEITIAGVAKGAGMLAPKMATMLAFIMTDAAATPVILKAALKRALPNSFNAVTVDGDMSTNDTLMLMASGMAGNRALGGRELVRFQAAVEEVACALARGLVYDGEGATKLVAIEVRGARSAADAGRVARQVANSPLVKTAFFGCDPNVGRIIAAAGASGAVFDPDRVELWVGGVRIASHGTIGVEALSRAAEAMRRREFTVRLDLKAGKASAAILTSDLSFDYVRINAEYTT